jgi:hypothetical protein
MSGRHRRKVGAVRPSHLMFTSGVGSLIDLPNFSVLVRGTDDWDYFPAQPELVRERRLLTAVQRIEGLESVERLQKAPWLDEDSKDDAASRVGVPVAPFPNWLRCTACNELALASTTVFTFVNDNPYRPHEAKFVHASCPKSRRRPALVVAARFVLACSRGHLDDFPYTQFVHAGKACKESHPRMEMQDRSANLGANVEVRCKVCGASRNMREALGRLGEQNLPRCRGRHAHLRSYDPDGCEQKPKTLVVGASNQWFSRTLSALAVPRTGQSELAAKVAEFWENLEGLQRAYLPFARKNVPALQHFSAWPDDDELWAAIEHHQSVVSGEEEEPDGGDLRTEEWEAFTHYPLPDPTLDFTVRQAELAPELTNHIEDLVQVERLREARALVGFTRLDAPDPEDPDLVESAPLSRDENPSWVPATEVRGEGLFVKLPELLLSGWEQEVRETLGVDEHYQAYGRYRKNRYSDRLPGGFDPFKNWPGARYIALHTLSHLLIRTIALECGYSSASLSERIYAGTEEDPRTGILIYTAVPDSEGTLGGLVSLGEPRDFSRIFRRALRDADRCSSDPLCVERHPVPSADFLHGAACHVCLFVSETTCERGNRFLDRRFVVPLDPALPSLFKGVP